MQSIIEYYQITGMAKVRPSVEYICNLMSEMEDDQKMLVFAHHVEVCSTHHVGTSCLTLGIKRHSSVAH